MVYQWKAGARAKADAQAAGEMCERLEAEGRLSAKALLEENRPEEAPLHDCFEWQDSEAAEQWRLHQARNIINSLIVVPERSEPVRGFFRVETGSSRYTSIQTIVRDLDSYEALMETALRELSAIQKKYRSIEQLSGVWDAIDKALERKPA